MERVLLIGICRFSDYLGYQVPQRATQAAESALHFPAQFYDFTAVTVTVVATSIALCRCTGYCNGTFQ